jgi:hypothetical protein
MSSIPSRRIRVSRPTLDDLESVSLVSVLPTLTAAPEWMDAKTGG